MDSNIRNAYAYAYAYADPESEFAKGDREGIPDSTA